MDRIAISNIQWTVCHAMAANKSSSISRHSRCKRWVRWTRMWLSVHSLDMSFTLLFIRLNRILLATHSTLTRSTLRFGANFSWLLTKTFSTSIKALTYSCAWFLLTTALYSSSCSIRLDCFSYIIHTCKALAKVPLTDSFDLNEKWIYALPFVIYHILIASIMPLLKAKVSDSSIYQSQLASSKFALMRLEEMKLIWQYPQRAVRLLQGNG